MTHKTIVKVVFVMLIVFGATILLYPTMFNPDDKNKTPIEAPPMAPTAPITH